MIAAILLLSACSRLPSDALTWRESWEILALSEDGAVIDAQVEVGNTGLLRGQGRVRLDRWNTAQPAQRFARLAGPAEVQLDPSHDEVTIGTDRLARSEDGSWRFRLRGAPDVPGGDVQASLQVSPSASPPPPVAWLAGGGEWRIEAPVPGGRVDGFVTDGRLGGQVRGRGVLLHQGGDGLPAARRRAVYVLADLVRIGFDRRGDHVLSWAEVDGQTYSPLSLTWPDGEAAVLRAEGLWVEVRPRRVGGRTDPFAHLLGPERWLFERVALAPDREVRAARARVIVGDATRLAPAVMLAVDRPEALDRLWQR